MKTLLKILIIILILGIFGFLGYKIIYKLKVKKKAAEMIAMLPDFKFYRLSGEAFTRNNLLPDMPVVVFHFSPDCENCKYEAGEFAKNMHLFQHTQILMISSKAKERIDEFIKYFKLNEHPQVTALWDTDNQFFNYFGMGMNPLTIIYNKKQELVKYYKGEVQVEEIHKRIQ